jgi:hypothetical protein
MWQGVIEFYGMVVDENSDPVPAAHVAFHWVEVPDEAGNRTATAESDSSGLFTLKGQRGLSLAVSVTKEGYRSSARDIANFNYGSLNGEAFQSDPLRPAFFHLRKKGLGAELVTSENGVRTKLDVRVPRDNTPVRVDLLQKRADPAGELEISQDKPPWQGAREWGFSQTIPSGGLVENHDEFQFEAPNTDYQSAVRFKFTNGETNWTTQVTKQFYIALGEPRKYGWLRIESNLAQETVFLTYALNPTGSRNLEPAN